MHRCLADFPRLQTSVQVLANTVKAKFDPAVAYATEGAALQAQLQQAVDQAEASALVHQVQHVVWTKTLERMYFLAKQYASTQFYMHSHELTLIHI